MYNTICILHRKWVRSNSKGWRDFWGKKALSVDCIGFTRSKIQNSQITDLRNGPIKIPHFYSGQNAPPDATILLVFDEKSTTKTLQPVEVRKLQRIELQMKIKVREPKKRFKATIFTQMELGCGMPRASCR